MPYDDRARITVSELVSWFVNRQQPMFVYLREEHGELLETRRVTNLLRCELVSVHNLGDRNGYRITVRTPGGNERVWGANREGRGVAGHRWPKGVPGGSTVWTTHPKGEQVVTTAPTPTLTELGIGLRRIDGIIGSRAGEMQQLLADQRQIANDLYTMSGNDIGCIRRTLGITESRAVSILGIPVAGAVADDLREELIDQTSRLLHEAIYGEGYDYDRELDGIKDRTRARAEPIVDRLWAIAHGDAWQPSKVPGDDTPEPLIELVKPLRANQ